MPKNRKRVIQKGAKSVSIRTKHKIGGRKSGNGVKQMSTKDLTDMLPRLRKRDYRKVETELDNRPNGLDFMIG